MTSFTFFPGQLINPLGEETLEFSVFPLVTPLQTDVSSLPPARSRHKRSKVMEPLKFTEHFKVIVDQALQLHAHLEANAIMFVVESPVDWPRLKKLTSDAKVIAVATNERYFEGASECGFTNIHVRASEDEAIYNVLTQGILRAVADDNLNPGSRIIAIYSGFDPTQFDSVSVINLGEHLDRLSGRDLRQLESKVPLKTLKMVVDLAVEVGREGREGKSVGTLFVIGDTRSVMMQSKPAGFDPVRGYQRKERNLNDPRVREGIKEIAQLDGAFVISADGVCEAACRYLDTSTATITLSKGLGARHWAGAAISRTTNAIAIVVSQSTGTVRIFQNGEVVLRIESRHRRPMVWRDFDYEPPVIGE